MKTYLDKVNDWELKPFTKVGVFEFGHCYEEYQSLLQSWDEERQLEDSTTFYIVGTNSYLTADNNKNIESITCKEKCNYKGINLIGKTLKEVESILNVKAVFDENLADQDVYDVDDCGLMLWIKDNAVVSIDCNRYIDPDEI
jgi:hypothetical protein